MKTAKLVIGIVSIVLALVMLFQSCAANVGSVLATAGTDMSGAVGTFAAILLIVAGPDRVGRCVAGVCRRVYHLCVCAALRAKSQVIAKLHFALPALKPDGGGKFLQNFLKSP